MGNTLDENYICNFGLVRDENNPGDSFTKIKHCPAVDMIIRKSHCSFPIKNVYTGSIMNSLLEIL